MKTTCKKSRPMNLLQVSNLPFDHCFKLKWGHHTKTAIYLLYIGPWARNSHHEQIKYSSFLLQLHKTSYNWHLLGSVYYFNCSCSSDFPKSQCCCPFTCTWMGFLPAEALYFYDYFDKIVKNVFRYEICFKLYMVHYCKQGNHCSLICNTIIYCSNN